jgi:hypothetical protein
MLDWLGSSLLWLGFSGTVVGVIAAGVALRFAFPGVAETITDTLRPVGAALGKFVGWFITELREGAKYVFKSASALLFLVTACAVVWGVTHISTKQTTKVAVTKELHRDYKFIAKRKPRTATNFVRDLISGQFKP